MVAIETCPPPFTRSPVVLEPTLRVLEAFMSFVKILVDDSMLKDMFPVRSILVPETLASEDDPEVNTPVEVEIVNNAEEVPLPPSMPKRTWLSTPFVNPPPVEVENLFPCKS